MLFAPTPRLQIAPDTNREQRSARLEFRVPRILDEDLAFIQHPIMLAALPTNGRRLDIDAMAHVVPPGRPHASRRARSSARSVGQSRLRILFRSFISRRATTFSR